VKNVTDFGVFVDIGSEIDGLVHVSDISWSQRVNTLRDVQAGTGCRPGSSKSTRVPEILLEHQAPHPGSLGGDRDPLQEGDVVAGKVTRVADFGVFVELADGVEGLVHVSELSREKVDNPGSLFKAGDEVGAVVLGVDRATKKISLSIRAHHDERERKNMESYMSRSSDSSENLTVLGEALRAKLKINNE
jgi:small subunit ribosomal protein S1